MKRKRGRMTFYLIGLGLNLESISVEALKVLKKCKKIYLENYTVEFPYPVERLEEVVGKKIFPLTRLMVESEEFIKEAKHKDVALLVYGSPLIATTHISLILKCKKEGIEWRVFHNASIFDAITETGLQIYKFGKTASMPRWEGKYKPRSFIEIIKLNLAIKAHTLILIDRELTFPEALEQLKRACKGKIKLNKLVVCSNMGTKEGRIYYANMEELMGAEVFQPFCIILPSELHFMEEEALNLIKEKI